LGKVENLFSISSPLLEYNQIPLVPDTSYYRDPDTLPGLILINIKVREMKILEVDKNIFVLNKRNAYPS